MRPVEHVGLQMLGSQRMVTPGDWLLQGALEDTVPLEASNRCNDAAVVGPEVVCIYGVVLMPAQLRAKDK